MKLCILMGTLVLLGLTVSCATDPEEVAPSDIVEDVPRVVVESSVPAEPELGGVASVDRDRSPRDSMVTDSTTDPDRASSPPQTAPAAPIVTSDGANSDGVDAGDPPSPPSGISEPTIPALPEPGGPWIDPHEPDFTKTVPPPRD
jgi:hypothetical protein